MVQAPLKYTKEQVRQIAERRSALHENQASTVRLAADYELKGVAGEAALAELTGRPIVELDHPGGDDGDALVAIRLSDGQYHRAVLDVKCTVDWLLRVNQKTVNKAHIYVLAHYLGDAEAQLVGWATRQEIREAPLVVAKGGRITNHVLDREELRNMAELEAMIVR